MVQIEHTRSLVAALEHPDPVQALRAAAALQSDVDGITTVLVRRARISGLTWAEIAFALGVSRQAVHQRYGR